MCAVDCNSGLLCLHASFWEAICSYTSYRHVISGAAVPKVKKGALPASAVSRAQQVVKDLTLEGRVGPSKELLRWIAEQQTSGYAITAKPSANLYILLQVRFSLFAFLAAILNVFKSLTSPL